MSENFVEKSTLMYGINPLYSYSAPGYTTIDGLKVTNIKLDFTKDTAKLTSGKELLPLENNNRGGISSVMGDRHVVSEVNKQILYIDANNLYGCAMSQYLPTGEFEKLPLNPCNYNLDQLVEDLLEIPDEEYGFFIECNLEYPIVRLSKKADTEIFTLHMNRVKQLNYKPTQKLVCDLTNKQKI